MSRSRRTSATGLERLSQRPSTGVPSMTRIQARVETRSDRRRRKEHTVSAPSVSDLSSRHPSLATGSHRVGTLRAAGKPGWRRRDREDFSRRSQRSTGTHTRAAALLDGSSARWRPPHNVRAKARCPEQVRSTSNSLARGTMPPGALALVRHEVDGAPLAKGMVNGCLNREC